MHYIHRSYEALIREMMAELPALLLVGPRATGKTTTAARFAASLVRLDREREAAAFRADPDAALEGLTEPILLDEWQAVPEVLGAVKRAVDVRPEPNRFVLTGSVRGDLDAETWPGTGRLVRLRFWGLSVRELRAGGENFVPLLDRLSEGGAIADPVEAPDLLDYVEMAATGGFPQVAASRSSRARELWLESYIDQLVTRDAASIEMGRDPERLRRYFEGYALNSAGVAAEKTLLETAQVSRKAAEAYEQLLKNLFVVESIPAWTSNRLQRLIKAPKRYVVDPALLVALLRLEPRAILRDGNLLGRLLETFVVAQLRAELDLCRCRPRLYHLRDANGRHEVDLLCEMGGGRVIGIEIKATAAPRLEDCRHLVWMSEALGDRFVRGVVIHTGPRSFALSDQVLALPIASIWS